MAVIEGGVSGSLVEVGVGAAVPMHTTPKPIPYGALGHYRSAVRFSLVASQAASSRLWEVRNTGTNLLIPTLYTVKWTQTSAHTAAIRLELDLFKATGFTAVDTTNTVTPSGSVKRTSGMAAFPGNAAIRHVTVAGASAGMTGGTVTVDGSEFAQVSLWMLTTVPTGGPVPYIRDDFLAPLYTGTHPFVLAQNEGLVLQNDVLAGAAAGSDVIVDFSWAEVTAF